MLDHAVQQPLQMVDLGRQHQRIGSEIQQAMEEVISSCKFINGPAVSEFAEALSQYTAARHVIPCANGTDALQLAMMGLGLQPGDEVIVPTFTYVATAEVIALLNLQPVFVDVNPDTFNIDVQQVTEKISARTRAVVPVHLFGQCADMEPLLHLAEKHQFYVIEDTAQALGATYDLQSGETKKAGTLGTVGATSFFPSKNLGCYGDGGAMMTDQSELAAKLKAISNHGQEKKYYHDMIGVNSRLDSLQAAILNVKLKHLDDYCRRRQVAARYYNQALEGVEALQIPVRQAASSHVYNQYTLKVKDGRRDALKDYLKEQGIPSMIYYPLPLHKQKAYAVYGYQPGDFPVAEALTQEVLSLPMHTELEEEQLAYIVHHVKKFFHG